MTDPFAALRAPVVPIAPDPTFAANLRTRLERTLLESPGDPMTTTSPTPPATRPALTAYLAVDDARNALDWYAEVFAAERAGEPIVMPDGRIGHAELVIGGSPLFLADEHPGLGLLGPKARGGVTGSIVVEVPDVDATVDRAVAAGAELTRPVADQSYGRNGVIVDPFGHRWMVSTSQAEPARDAAPGRHGDIGYASLHVPDAQPAKDFYGAVLGWRFTPGSVEDSWQVDGPAPGIGLAGGADRPEVQLCYRVDDVDAAVARVQSQGGSAQPPAQAPYGRMAYCVDNQGVNFQLWQP